VTRYENELERIRRAYAERDDDAAPAAPGGWSDPAYRFFIQRLEWSVLRALDRSGLMLAGSRVLEVGCGAGYFANRFTEYGAASAAGIDLMEDRIRIGRERYPHLELVAGDAGALPWDDASFDLVTQFTCLSAIFDQGVRERVAAEMWRVLRPSGVICSFDLDRPHALLRALRRVRQRRPPAQAGPGTETTPVEVEQLTRLFPGIEAAPVVGHLSDGASGLARRHRWLAEAASAVPVLRTHLLFAARKP
jgi:ubiquinone/menaquinone biosynthesis C-methylase UbiE